MWTSGALEASRRHAQDQIVDQIVVSVELLNKSQSGTTLQILFDLV